MQHVVSAVRTDRMVFVMNARRYGDADIRLARALGAQAERAAEVVVFGGVFDMAGRISFSLGFGSGYSF